MTTNHDSFTYKGYSYLIPACCNSNPTIRFSGFKLESGEQSFSGSEHEERMFIVSDAENDCRLSIRMDETDCGDDLNATYEVTFHIYRVGKELPVLTVTEAMQTGYYFEAKFPPLTQPLDAGAYFLLFDAALEDNDLTLEWQDGRLFLPFFILKSRDKSTLPAVETAKAVRPQDECRTQGYTSGALRLQLQLAHPIREMHELTAICYTEDWEFVACDKRLVTPRKCSQTTRHFCFRWSKIWMAGRYTAILMYNREPFAAIDFSYRGKTVTPCTCRPLSAQDVAYHVAKNNRATDGNTPELLHKCIGLARLTPYLTNLLRISEYNRFCENQQLTALKVNPYVSISSLTTFRAKQVAFCLPKLSGYQISEYKQTDCAQWVKDEAPESLLESRKEVAFTLYNVGILCSEKGAGCLAALESAVKETGVYWALTLCGTADEIKRLFAISPTLEQYVCPEYRIQIGLPSAAEVVHLMQDQLGEAGISLDSEAENRLALQVYRHIDNINTWTQKEMRCFVMQGMVKQLRLRIYTHFINGKEIKQNNLGVLSAADISLDAWLANRKEYAFHGNCTDIEQSFAESMNRLNEMVGLQSLKDTLSAIFCRIRFNEHRSRLGLPAEAHGAYHFIFTGNPGTGKTTVAQLLGKVFHALGILSKGEVITTGRNELVGTYIGQTEEKVNKLLERARGNVLFIDEAYNLYTDSDDHRDYGSRIIEGLLPVLAEPHPDMIIVLAGYEDEMERMLQSNPGLKGRFSYRLHFEDYSADELMQIAARFFKRNDYLLSDEAEQLLRETVAQTLAAKDRCFSNARWINQFIASGILPAMAQRVIQQPSGDAGLYRTIECSDIEQAIGTLQPKATIKIMPRRRIGFRA